MQRKEFTMQYIWMKFPKMQRKQELKTQLSSKLNGSPISLFKQKCKKLTFSLCFLFFLIFVHSMSSTGHVNKTPTSDRDTKNKIYRIKNRTFFVDQTNRSLTGLCHRMRRFIVQFWPN